MRNRQLTALHTQSAKFARPNADDDGCECSIQVDGFIQHTEEDGLAGAEEMSSSQGRERAVNVRVELTLQARHQLVLLLDLLLQRVPLHGQRHPEIVTDTGNQ